MCHQELQQLSHQISWWFLQKDEADESQPKYNVSLLDQHTELKKVAEGNTSHGLVTVTRNCVDSFDNNSRGEGRSLDMYLGRYCICKCVQLSNWKKFEYHYLTLNTYTLHSSHWQTFMWTYYITLHYNVHVLSVWISLDVNMNTHMLYLIGGNFFCDFGEFF